ncbi:Vitellogenin receptor [Operophtera brumata]|uniref:Vitellogenin receptor n=1 Tax=Operophtera brumata TaxID=104452 RepID=A0A0L7KXR1_OPEBR|nr:Vitellogenin receptor [Operophtera brumata]
MKSHIATLSVCLVVCTAQFMDEMQQFEEECLGEDKFSCMGGGCIPQSQYCDDVINCEDGTDESFCVGHTPDVKFCNATHHFMCLDHKKCIPYQWICNKEADCDDGSDETNCTSSVVADNY